MAVKSIYHRVPSITQSFWETQLDRLYNIADYTFLKDVVYRVIYLLRPAQHKSQYREDTAETKPENNIHERYFIYTISLCGVCCCGPVRFPYRSWWWRGFDPGSYFIV